MGINILVLPDSHAKPGVPNDRYDWLGQMIIDLRPDVVVDLGDFADMESLSTYDKSKKSFEGRRLKLDIECAVDARERLTRPLQNLQLTQQRWKEKVYRPRLIALEGNHEYRLAKLMNNSPELDGFVDRDVSSAAENGWEWYPFLEKVTVEGITFVHYFHNDMGNPLSGSDNPAGLLRKKHESFVVGHSHKWRLAHDVTGSDRKIMGIIAGCYFDQYEYYAKQTNKAWDRCITYLRNVEDGFTLDVDVYSMERIKALYGQKEAA